MAAVATLGTYKKSSFKIYIFICLALAVWLTYDGYFSPVFAEKHTKDGKMDSTLKANRVAPFVLLPAALILVLRWRAVKDKTIVADGKSLILDNGEKIDYDKIEKIDKKNFEKRGYFVITYKNDAGRDVERKLSDKDFDKLEDILAELVGAMKGGQA
jgi:predicted AlkP superfamily phosphohydrolase/phosphomutase